MSCSIRTTARKASGGAGPGAAAQQAEPEPAAAGRGRACSAAAAARGCGGRYAEVEQVSAEEEEEDDAGGQDLGVWGRRWCDEKTRGRTDVAPLKRNKRKFQLRQMIKAYADSLGQTHTALLSVYLIV